MKKLLLILIFTLGSLSCFSVELHTKEGYGTVSFYRQNSFIGIVMDAEIMINQSVIGTIKSGEYIDFTLDPGVYLIHIALGNIHKNTTYEVIKITVQANRLENYQLIPLMYRPINVKKIEKKLKLKESNIIRWVGDEK